MKQYPVEKNRTIDFLKMAALFAIVAVWPKIIPLVGGYTGLAVEMVIFAIFALGFDLLLGYTGILSFGQAAYFGLAGYSMGISVFILRSRFYWPCYLGSPSAPWGPSSSAF
jgi:branched-chain amino acid transport system ATP-binding protein